MPAFLGWFGGEAEPEGAAGGGRPLPSEVTRWARFEQISAFRPGKQGSEDPADARLPVSFTHHAVRGFFENGGRCCFVVRLRDPDEVMREQGLASRGAGARAALREALAALEPEPRVDLVCAPDLMLAVARIHAAAAEQRKAPDPGELRAAERECMEMQWEVVDHCRRMGTRLAILDALPLDGNDEAQLDKLVAQAAALESPFAALYHPWLRTTPDSVLPAATVPPGGHVAGIYARSDEEAGVQKAPANEELLGVTDLAPPVGETEHRRIPLRINCLRAFPRRGILVWGARTLAGPEDADWTYVNVRRLFVQVARWIERALADTAFEVNGPPLWSRITREVSAYLGEMYRAGALAGGSAAEAFYVRCDATTTPPELVAEGQVVAEIGLATHVPHEFVVVRVTHGAAGTHVSGPLPG